MVKVEIYLTNDCGCPAFTGKTTVSEAQHFVNKLSESMDSDRLITLKWMGSDLSDKLNLSFYLGVRANKVSGVFVKPI